jgi:hypothetical protein
MNQLLEKLKKICDLAEDGGRKNGKIQEEQLKLRAALITDLFFY